MEVRDIDGNDIIAELYANQRPWDKRNNFKKLNKLS